MRKGDLEAAWRLCRTYLPGRSDVAVGYADLRAQLDGWCHHRPWDAAANGEGRHGGGYVHWRCRHRRGHAGLHRFNNYIWDADGNVDYVPTPVLGLNRPIDPRSPWTDHIRTASYRQRLRHLREWKVQHAKIRARIRDRSHKETA